MSDASQTNLGVAPNVGGLLCYTPCCVGLVFSAVVAIVEKQSRFLRFHALQSLLIHAVALVLGIGLTVAQVVLGMIAGPLALLVWVVQVLVGLAFLGLVILMMVKAYGNEEFRLPTLGDLAQKWV